MKNEINLKIMDRYFNDVIRGLKTFEIRSNDRKYYVNQILNLYEICIDEKENECWNYTTRSVRVRITYILSDPLYVKEGYVVLGIKLCFKDKVKIKMKGWKK
ncbi:MAG: DUF3850 domain-containing protein [Coprobacillaceae bacterium]